MTDRSLVVVESPGAVATAAEIRANVNLIQEVLRAVMKDGTHFGKIPGTQKPSLFKAGAEKILSTFRIAIEPFAEDLSTFDCARYRVTCRATSQITGAFLGAGIGECSSSEEKYSYRGVVHEKEWNATPEDRRRVKFTRDGGETKQVRTNPADVANTVLKMAKKRAQIDATLTVTAASDIFTQDIEDLPAEIREAVAGDEAPAPLQRPQPKAAPVPAPAPMREPGDEPEGETHRDRDRDPSTPVLSVHGKPVTRLPLPEVHDSPRISEAQAKRYWAIGKGRGLEDDELRLWLIEATGYSHSKDIQRAHYDAIVTALQAL